MIHWIYLIIFHGFSSISLKLRRQTDEKWRKINVHSNWKFLFNFLPFLSNGSVSSFSFSSCIVDTEEIFETFYLNSAVFSLWGVSIFMAQKFNFQTSFMILFTWLFFFCNTKKSNMVKLASKLDDSIKIQVCDMLYNVMVLI